MQSENRGRNFLGAIVSVILTLAIFVALELAAGRFVESPIDRARRVAVDGDTISSTLAWLWINPAPLIKDDYLLWHNRPDAERSPLINPRSFDRSDEWTIRTNSHGFRGPELRSMIAAEDTYRILCIGDSVTFGYSADQDDTYPAQLAAILERRYPDRDIEVINAGTPGWSWIQGLRFLDNSGVALQPDLVIMAHGVNDQFMRARVTDRERFEHIDKLGIRAIAGLRRLVAGTNLYQVIEQNLPVPALVSQESPGCVVQRERHGGCKRVALPEIESAVLEVHRIARANDFDLLILNLDFLRTAAVDGVRRAVNGAGLEFIDFAERIDTVRKADDDELAAKLGLAVGGELGTWKPRTVAREGRKVVFRVLVPGPDAQYSVSGGSWIGPEYEFSEMLVDDGSGGDEIAGDGVFSFTLIVPSNVATLSFVFYRDGDPEFIRVPPSQPTTADRGLNLGEHLRTPVYVYGRRRMMTERVHPNADGYALISTEIADALERFPSFRRLGTPLPAAPPQ